MRLVTDLIAHFLRLTSKDNMTKEQFLEKWNAIQQIVKPLTVAMEEANKADSSSKNGINSHISGAPFNSMYEALLETLTLQFNYKCWPELNVDWGANDSFYDDVKKAAEEAFISKEI